MPAAQTPPRLITLILLTSLSVLSLNMFLPSLSRIATDLDADYALVSLAIGGYLAVSAVLQLIMGPLSDMVGRRPVLLAGLAVFIAASIGCTLAGDIWTFLAFRVLQGAVVSGMVLSRAVVRDMAPPSEAARLLGVIGTAMALAPLLGPVLGGLLDEAFGWRASFVAYAVMGSAMLWVTWTDLGETNTRKSTSFTAQFRSYPELVRSALFWVYCICLVFSVGGFYAFLGGAPQVGEAMFGLTPAWLGLGMGSISGGFMLGNYLSGRLAPRKGIMWLMITGRWCGTLGPLAAMALLGAGVMHPAVMFGGAIFVGLGNGLTLPGANAGVMSVAPHLAGSASGLSGALTVAGGALITSGVGVLVTGAFGIYALMGAMVLTSLVGLVSAYGIRALEARGAGA
jgi:DHA1 family bicyclomycin/chloramphenicol resistance-like MFS transporter